MPSPSTKNLNKTTQIVRLKHLMQRWRRRCTTTPSAGTLAVYVGPERRRFIIPTRFLNLPVFLSLLNKAEEEFGFQTTGGLVIPCDVTFFKKLLSVLSREDNGLSRLGLDEFTAMFNDLEIASTVHCKDRCKDVNRRSFSFMPLLQKARV